MFYMISSANANNDDNNDDNTPASVELGNNIGGTYPPPIGLAYITLAGSGDWGDSYLGVDNYIDACDFEVFIEQWLQTENWKIE